MIHSLMFHVQLSEMEGQLWKNLNYINFHYGLLAMATVTTNS